MSEIRERAKEWLKAPVSMVRAEDIVVDLMAELERVEAFREKLRKENAYVNDMLENAHNRSKLLEAKTIEARQQAARECVEIMWKMENQRRPGSLGACDLVRTSYAAAVIRNHFGLEG